jgi:hypothetical protein
VGTTLSFEHQNERKCCLTPSFSRQKTLKLGVSEKWWAAISQAYKRLQRWLVSTAPQLDCQQTFERYLCWNNPLNPENWLASPSP